MKKSAVLLVSFGTSYLEALRNCIESTETKIHEAFSGYEFRRAFTSEFIIHKMAKRDGVQIDNTLGALQKLQNEGFKRVVVQPLHIIPGYEYHDVKEAVDEFERRKVFDELYLGEPLLYHNEDYQDVVEALQVQLKKNNAEESTVFMGHGTSHFSNACYYNLQSVFDEAGLKAYIANVEANPALGDIITKLKERKIRKVRLMPFMLVAGDHAQNDMAGQEGSWKAILENEGFNVNIYMHGLGENDAIREIFVRKALKVLQ